MNYLHKVIISIVAVILIVFIGCAGVQDVITPAYVSEDAAKWSSTPTKVFTPYTSLWDAKRVSYAMEYTFALEKIKYGYYRGIMDISLLAGEELKQIVFSPGGPIGLLATTVSGGVLGAFLIKRPGDKSKKEVEAENNK